jgi:hypothetical protein
MTRVKSFICERENFVREKGQPDLMGRQLPYVTGVTRVRWKDRACLVGFFSVSTMFYHHHRFSRCEAPASEL